jgi:predicted O-methyltransferase YrrM
MTKEEILSKLAAQDPSFHYADEDVVARAAQAGITLPLGPMNLRASLPVLRWIADSLRLDMVTLETGAGQSTVVFAALASRHFCLTFKREEADRITAYLEQCGVDPGKVTFVIGSTDVTLPGLATPPLDFVFIDGCHGYPYPAMDWHHADKLLKIGGLLGMDNAELRPVADHCRVLEANGAYRPRETVRQRSTETRFYEKLIDQDREWVSQPYSRVREQPSRPGLVERARRKAMRGLRRATQLLPRRSPR